MTYDCFILHNDQTLEPARRLARYLSRPGGQVGLGNAYQECDVLLCLIPLTELADQSAFEHDSIIIPLAATMVSDRSPDQWIESVLERLVVLAAHGRSAREATETVDTTELTRAAFATLERATDASSGDDLLKRIESILETTQALSDSLAQASQHESRWELYQRANHILLDLITESEIEDFGVDVIASIVDILEDAAERANDAGDDDESAIEIFEDCYTYLLLGLETSYALQTVDALIESIISSGRAASASLIAEVIKVAMTHGDDLFERDAYQWALQVYLMAAQGVYRLVNDSVSESTKTAEVAVGSLALYAEITIDGPIANAEQLCTDLRETLDNVLAAALGERAWEHDS
ncbi:MAG: hypothetical protein ACON3Z_12175 [Bradymonadia bacterium]